MGVPHHVTRKETAMRWNGNRSGDWTEVARRGVGPLTVALREAQKRGEVAAGCEPEVVAHFVVASLKGALLVSKLTRDATVMRQCMSELERYLALYEVPSSC
jgi:Tetracyclin repressor-like, C-terminal domain